MRIHDMSAEDIFLLDQLWAFDTSEEVNDFLRTLDDDTFVRAVNLMEMMHLAAIDEEVEKMDNYPDAEQLIKGIMS
jgi:hypothetical protein